jgi:hypothetical protein
MVIPRQKMHSKHDRSDEVMAALAAIIAPARATEGVMHLDIARDLLDPDSFIATALGPTVAVALLAAVGQDGQSQPKGHAGIISHHLRRFHRAPRAVR